MSRPVFRALPLLMAAAALGAGVWVYLQARAPGVYFWPHDTGTVPAGHWRLLTGSLPSAAHAYAFAVLTGSLLPPGRLSAAAACAGWWMLDALLELAQWPPLARSLSSALPSFPGVPALENVHGYLLRGTFDPLDLAAAGCGALAAFVTLRALAPRRIRP